MDESGNQSQPLCSPDAESSTEEDKRSKFGNRLLTDPQNVFQHNAWDNVVWDEEQEAMARNITEKQQSHLVASEKNDEYEREADLNWDKFYSQHKNRFFKDRHWLFTEFPELYGNKTHAESACSSHEHFNDEPHEEANDCESQGAYLPQRNLDSTPAQRPQDVCNMPSSQPHSVPDGITSSEDRTLRYLEVGCGVGNTVFPVLAINRDPNLMVYCCDFSSTAIQILKEHCDYDEKRCHAFVLDITDENPVLPFASGSLDIIIMIFVLSAVCPAKMQMAVNRLASYLKPGGTLLFRDYGRYDMAQLRFKQGRCLSENFYVRGDGTRVYFFTQDELKAMFEQAGLVQIENLIDRRLQVNRGRQLKMYRVWIQCKYRKLTESEDKRSSNN